MIFKIISNFFLYSLRQKTSVSFKIYVTENVELINDIKTLKNKKNLFFIKEIFPIICVKK